MTLPRRKPITVSITVLALCAIVTWLMPPSMAAGDLGASTSLDDDTMVDETAEATEGQKVAAFLTAMMEVLEDLDPENRERQSSPFVPTPGQGGTPPGRPDHEPGSGKPDDRPPAHAPGQNKDKDKDKD